MDRKNIIFVGGIHGVGKTTLCKKISSELSIEYFSSSELISKLDSQRVNDDKIAHDIKDNQNILLDAVQQFLYKDRIYLLDGHFCLIDSEHSIKQIPLNTYESLGIKEIILLCNDEEIILKRLKDRDNKEYSLEFIEKFQQNEIDYAQYVANKIRVPITTIDLSKEENDIENIIRDLSGRY